MAIGGKKKNCRETLNSGKEKKKKNDGLKK